MGCLVERNKLFFLKVNNLMVKMIMKIHTKEIRRIIKQICRFYKQIKQESKNSELNLKICSEHICLTRISFTYQTYNKFLNYIAVRMYILTLMWHRVLSCFKKYIMDFVNRKMKIK